MKNTDILKKYWFVLLIGILAIGFIIYYAIDSTNAQGKSVTAQKDAETDQYLLYTIDDEKYYVDDLYNALYPRFAFNSAFAAYDHMVTDKAVKTTSEMQTTAANSAQYLMSIYDHDTLESDLKQMGFDGLDELDDYYLYMLKNQQMAKEYFLAHQSEILDPYMQKNPKLISHILIRVADVEKVENEDGTTTLIPHPTDEETEKLNTVLEQLNDENNTFAAIAAQYSDDGSATNGGMLGVIDDDNKTNYVSEFADVAMALSEGQVSEVVVSEYGYHIIRCDASTLDTLLENSNFISAVYNTKSTLYAKVLTEKAQELNIVIEDEDLKQQLDAFLNDMEEQ